MRKGERTREKIIEQAAPLFNKMGVAGASVSDIMEATGLKKGGIYNHFDSKEELALLAFRYSSTRVLERMEASLLPCRSGTERLLAMAAVFSENANRPLVPGGCPLLNAAIDSDDGNKDLRLLVREAMDRWSAWIGRIVLQGQKDGEFRRDLVPDEVASCFIATLEGGVMLSRLYRDAVHVHRAVDFLQSYVRERMAQ